MGFDECEDFEAAWKDLRDTLYELAMIAGATGSAAGAEWVKDIQDKAEKLYQSGRDRICSDYWAAYGDDL